MHVIFYDYHFVRLFFVNDPATTEIYTLSLHDALPISAVVCSTLVTAMSAFLPINRRALSTTTIRSEEHTSELQSRLHLVCRLLLEKKNNNGVLRPLLRSRRKPQLVFPPHVLAL